MKRKWLPIFISVCLALVPFFWLKPGWMDLGGDSSRLYFYDPLNYLKSFPLYGVAPDGFGGPNIAYFLIPFVSILFGLKLIVQSPYLLITLFNSLQLVVSFLCVYRIIQILLNNYTSGDGKQSREFASIVGGMFYTLSPFLIPNGWDKAMYTHNQFFLNPLLFLMLLLYIHTEKFRFLLLALFITFIFAPNFSPSPAVFAFYSFTVLYLFLYAKIVKKRIPDRKKFFFGFLLFIGIHLFHLLPFVLSFFDGKSSVFYQAVFSDEGRFSRGLDYFISVAKTTKFPNNIISIPQGVSPVHRFLELLWFVFPLIIVFGFLLNQRIKKANISQNYNFHLLFIFFLITLFFITANITDLGFFLYKSLFYIPGFSMFRNYVGQFSFVFIFLYSIVLGHAVFFILKTMRSFLTRILFFSAILTLIIASSWSFLRGDMTNLVLNADGKEEIRVPIKMDPNYEKVLEYIRENPIDAKYLTLPFTEAGLQMVAGLEGGAYQGPSTIAYLTGKKDFSGYQVLPMFNNLFLQLARDKNYPSLNNLLSFLNIKYIFHNSDPYIYGENFPGLPYNNVNKFMPEDQESYTKFIENLAVGEKIDFGDKYHVYPIKDDFFLPHIYTSSSAIHINDPLSMPWFLSLERDNNRIAAYNIDRQGSYKIPTLNLKSTFRTDTDGIVLLAENLNPIEGLLGNEHLHIHEPFVTREPRSFWYPFVVFQEEREISQRADRQKDYIDIHLFYATKRLKELTKWGTFMPITHSDWEEPRNILELLRQRKFNSWEASLTRYENTMEKLIAWIENAEQSDVWKETNKIKVHEQILVHQLRFVELIENLDEKFVERKDKAYLLSKTQEIFDMLATKLRLQFIDPTNFTFRLDIPENKMNEYEMYVAKEDILDIFTSAPSLLVNGKTLTPLPSQTKSNFLQFNNAAINTEHTIFTLRLPRQNLIAETNWQGSLAEIEMREGDYTSIVVNNAARNNSGGITKEIHNLRPYKRYLITFDYNTYGENFIFRFNEKKQFQLKDNKQEGGVTVGTVPERILYSKDWKVYQTAITIDKETVGGYIQILGNAKKAMSRIDIRNLSVVEMPNPKIFFRKTALSRDLPTKPKITFTKINLTKYKIDVEDAYSPYNLIFSDGYSSHWKLFLPEEKSGKPFMQFLGNVLSKVIGSIILRRNDSSEEILASYFDGEVIEAMHRNSFLEGNTFETWGKRTVAEYKHFPVNGYANGWFIEPSDVNSKTDYTLILELTTQKQFYVLFFLSLFVVLIIIALLIKSFIHE